MNLSQLRLAIKTQRRQLSLSESNRNAQKITQQIVTQIWFQRSQRIAFYLPANGEVNTQPLIEHAWQMNKDCFLAVLHPLKHNSLLFAAYQPNQILVKNRYDIFEPSLDANTQIIPAWSLDLVFLPMVAFDSHCHRVGMGGGFYDRTFAFVIKADQLRPQLVGLAYEFQKVDELTPQIWDVGVDQVVTESTIYLPPLIRSSTTFSHKGRRGNRH